MLSGVLKPAHVDADAPEFDTINGSSGAHHEPEHEPGPYAKKFAIGVPVILLSVAVLMVYRAIFNPDEAIRGGDATALLGGTATLLLVLSTFAGQGLKAMEGIT